MNRITRTLLLGGLAATVFVTQGCAQKAKPGVVKSSFGVMADGRTADIYTLTNRNGAQAKITNYGGIVTALFVPDRKGRLGDVVLGYDTLAPYLTQTTFFGALIGRYGNRIGKGQFMLDGKKVQVTRNDGPNTLHGGRFGFDKVLWTAEPSDSSAALKLTYTSKDGEEGYPGNLTATVVYTLTDDNALRIDYEARTDKPTVVNLTHHSYFNLSADPSGDALGTELTILADHFTPVDATLIPTGEIRPVDGTPFDFRKPTKIGARIGMDDDQLKKGRGYDHNWVLNGWDGTLQTVAAAYDSASGRVMEVLTTEPGMQFYSGNFLDGTLTGKGGIRYNRRSGFCLETQHYPDSPNHPNFPSTVLRPGETYKTTTVYRFSAK
ncbi:MAG: aldose epimerase family protein [bacterium]|nr:aldose epimerase family protein [bacterium]